MYKIRADFIHEMNFILPCGNRFWYTLHLCPLQEVHCQKNILQLLGSDLVLSNIFLDCEISGSHDYEVYSILGSSPV